MYSVIADCTFEYEVIDALLCTCLYVREKATYVHVEVIYIFSAHAEIVVGGTPVNLYYTESGCTLVPQVRVLDFARLDRT